MNEDYLWNKTGSDREIERLEAALAEFRLVDQTPPKIQAGRFAAFSDLLKLRRFSYAFAFSAFAAVIVLLFGIWSLVRSSESRGQNIKPEIAFQKVDNISNLKTEQTAVSIESEPTVEAPQIHLPKQKPVRRLNRKTDSRQTESLRQDSAPAGADSVELTAEERYAYNQLMLALSITSSKLRLVREKVSGGGSTGILYKQTDDSGRN